MTAKHREQVSVRFRPHELEAVDAAAQLAHCTRSEIIREASVRLASSLLSATRLQRTALLPADLPVSAGSSLGVANCNPEVRMPADRRGSPLDILERMGK